MKIRIKENDDKEKVKKIREQINKNNGHCCCAIVFNNDNLCMCKQFRDQVKKKQLGFCHCGLYEVIQDDSKK